MREEIRSCGVVRLDATYSAHSGATVATIWADGRPIGQIYLDRVPALLSGSTVGKTSVVICTRDRPMELSRCLGSMPLQTRCPDEIVVVDNASVTDETEKVCRAAGVRYIREARPGLDIARNTGARAATGEIVAYTDDDVVLDPTWLERMVEAFDDPDIMAVTGLVLPAELNTLAQWRFEKYWGFGRGFERKDFGPDYYAATRKHGCPTWEIGAGASMAFRREVFERVGLFDERLDVGAAGCSGDSEFWHRILSHGWVCRYDPTIVAYHYHRRDIEGLRKQLRAYMRGHSAALMVQFERSGEWGNLRRICVTLPYLYARRILRRLAGRQHDEDDFLLPEISGFLSGIFFYLRTPRRLAGDRW